MIKKALDWLALMTFMAVAFWPEILVALVVTAIALLGHAS